MRTPLLSVCLITYNHVQYIKAAIDSVLMQKVKFPWKLIIADDFSTDGTREIILEYKEKYPDLIKLILQEKNVGPAKNWMDLITAPTSKYIAYLEGDDYWTDPLKLQKQVDFMEKNPEYSLCFHNAVIHYQDVNVKARLFNQISGSKEVALKELMEWVIPTASIVFRSSILPLPSWSTKIYSGDMTLALIAFMKGKIFSMRECMSVYRQNFHDNSSTSKMKNRGDFMVDQHILLFTYFNKESQKKFDNIISNHIRCLKKRKRYWKLKQVNKYLALVFVPGYTLKRLREKYWD